MPWNIFIVVDDDYLHFLSDVFSRVISKTSWHQPKNVWEYICRSYTLIWLAQAWKWVSFCLLRHCTVYRTRAFEHNVAFCIKIVYRRFLSVHRKVLKATMKWYKRKQNIQTHNEKIEEKKYEIQFKIETIVLIVSKGVWNVQSKWQFAVHEIAKRLKKEIFCLR